MVAHFYHVYSDGEWQTPVEDHARALADGGLREHLSGLYLGVVGADVDGPVECFRDYGLDPYVWARASEGWEQVTLEALWRYCHVNDGPVFYAHTKGAANQSEINTAWRLSMTYYTVMQWRDALAALDTHDAAGCHWIDEPNGNRFFGGTFWWANSRYIRSLPPVSYHSRWMAEIWIGEGHPIVRDLNPGHPALRGRFVTEW